MNQEAGEARKRDEALYLLRSIDPIADVIPLFRPSIPGSPASSLD